MKIPKLKCNRCIHEWIRRKEEEPKTCPKCNSPYWNKKRKASLLQVKKQTR